MILMLRRSIIKRLTSLVLSSALLAGAVPAFAAGDDEPTITINGVEITEDSSTQPPSATDLPEPTSAPMAAPAGSAAAPAAETGTKYSTVTVDLTMQQKPYTIDSFAVLELYSDTGELLDSDSMWVGGITTNLTYVFDVPEYSIGQSFRLRLAGGLTNLRYYDNLYTEGSYIDLGTYSYKNENGEAVAATSFAMDATPYFQKSVSLSYDGVPVALTPGARVVDGVTLVPIAQLAQYIGLDTYYDSTYNTQVVSLGGNAIYFNLGTDYTTVFGTDLTATHTTVWLDGSVFASLRTFADALGCTLEVTDSPDMLYVNMTSSQMVNDYFNNIPINSRGITSRTDYLVWISLSEFKVRVYLGKQYQWKPIREMTCAIGAPESPTITGSFEYQYSMPRWDYGTYYVGPCLVFYGNYAIHSVFLYQDGSEYDGRVGMQLSHGCIRLKKADIDWMYSMIPIGTRIYITP